MMQRIFLLVFTTIAILVVRPLQGITQEIDMAIVVRQIDLRNETAETAVVSALQASKKQVIVIMVKDGTQELIDQTHNELRALMYNGFERVVLVLANGFTDDTGTTIAIYAGGHTYALMKDVIAGAKTSSDFYMLVRDAYKEFVAVK
ncbi:hypothetical protein [Lewinella sp. LCG006]|uniref:hypothetical protein n=1 Tax=Lewinella sp. LCG006 TaxID=3231911 RepID=UPI0034605526